MHSSRRTNRRQACLRCREQKVRCDIADTGSESCSRCGQSGQECKPAPLHRRYAERTSRDQTRRSQVPLKAKPPESELVITPPTSIPDHDDSHKQSDLVSHLGLPRMNVAAKFVSQSRDLNGLFFEAQKIDEIFQSYFQDYAPLIPVLDSTMSPDQYFDKSPLLFWSIMTVAGRRSSLSRDVVLELTRRTMSLAMTSINVAALHVVESLLILLNWWLLTVNTLIEVPAVHVGSLLHLAMHIGLHNPARSQDFARTRLDLTRQDISHRAILWAHTVILYQKYWSIVGIPCDNVNSLGSDAQLTAGPLPQYLQDQRTLFNILTTNLSHLAKESQLAENGVSPVNIDSLIRLGDSQLMTLKPQSKSPEACQQNSSTSINAELLMAVEELHWLICRMMIYSHHLHQPLPQPTDITLTLYNLACSVLRHMQKLQNTLINFVPAGTTFVTQSSKIALFTLVALTANPLFRKLVNVPEAHGLVLYAISKLHDFRHGTTNDMDWITKIDIVIRRLLSSQMAFRDEKGESTLELRIKTRGPMSVVHDATWWARQEQGGLSDVYKGNQPGYIRTIAEKLTETHAQLDPPSSDWSSQLMQTAIGTDNNATILPSNSGDRMTTEPPNQNNGSSNTFDGMSFEDTMVSDIDWDYFNDFFLSAD